MMPLRGVISSRRALPVFLLPAAVLLLVLSSCLRGLLSEGPSCPEGFVAVKVAGCGAPALTKGSRLGGCEEASSGAFVAVYRSSDGVLQCVTDVQDGTEIVLHEDVEYDFFLMGNLNYIRRDDGEVCNLREALGADFPVTRESLMEFPYRFDGGNVGTTVWRREGAADVVSLGIPYSGSRMGVTPGQLNAEGGLYFQDASYLFAKVVLTVDHSQMDGGAALAEDWFRNVSLSVRQVNCSLFPFSSSFPCALSADDILGGEGDPLEDCFDYDGCMVNGSRVEYTLYVPANVQGVLLEGNADPSLKTPGGLVSAGKGEKAGLCTYVEFIGSVSSEGGGYRGDVRYRFFLGADSCADFSVLPGRVYHITLALSVEGVFRGVWKVSGSIVDQRTLGLFRDAPRADSVPYGGTLSLGAEQALEVFVSCDDGAGRDLFVLSTFTGPGWHPRGLDDVGLGCSFWDPSDGDSAWLSECGIGAEWDRARRCLVFRVMDEARFRPHIGESRLLEVCALPGDGACWRSFTLELVDLSAVVSGGYFFTVGPAYVGTSSILSFSRREFGGEGPSYVSVSLDGSYWGDYPLGTDGEVDLGVLSEGEHDVDLELCYEGGGSVWEMVRAEVCPVPTVSVTFGQRSLMSTCWKKVRDADGNPYVAHRRSWGRIWAEFTPQGRWDGVSFRTQETFFSLTPVPGSPTTVDIDSRGYGDGEILLDFTLGESVCTVSVPYISYEEIVFRAMEEHKALEVFFTNVIWVGWTSFVNATTGTLHATVVWNLSLSLLCSDGTRRSGRWGPFTDVSAEVGGGARYLRNFKNEFKELKKEFQDSGHRLTDAERLEGEMSFRVTFGSRYYVANVSGATFSDFSGMVEAVSETPSAHPLLQHWMRNSSWFYGYR